MFEFFRNNPLLMRAYYSAATPTRLSRLKIDSSRLAPIIQRNRKTLAGIARWVDDDVYLNSIFNYGLPHSIRDFIDVPLSAEPTYSDIITYIAGSLGNNIRYLELGVSVGKNFLQVAKSITHSHLVGIDIEDINPVLESQFVAIDQEEWDPWPQSIRKSRSRLSRYKVNSNSVTYIAGDIFDTRTWDAIAETPFNLVFSDAFHSSDALISEWKMIQERGLLADKFVFVWDDLGSAKMRKAFADFSNSLPDAFASIELFRGWVGHHERHHPIGIIRSSGIEIS